jgi:hypothetical protein
MDIFMYLHKLGKLLIIRMSLDRTYHGTAMAVCPSVRSGFSAINFISLSHITLKLALKHICEHL